MFDVEKFIECMKNKPCLWDRRVEEYSQKQSRKQAWLQIGEIMYDDWADCKPRIITERVPEWPHTLSQCPRCQQTTCWSAHAQASRHT
ncbi:hypothetical protein J6590_026511 [Homalodisca vitripennis]|nr:hypothetical protein J6590_026511 [Homalodisca vitripennis]